MEVGVLRLARKTRRRCRSEEVRQVDCVRVHERHGLPFVGDDVHADARDEVAGFVGRFQVLEGDIFAALELDEVLDSA